MEPLWFHLAASVKVLQANPAFESTRTGLSLTSSFNQNYTKD